MEANILNSDGAMAPSLHPVLGKIDASRSILESETFKPSNIDAYDAFGL